ncbi:MAG: hypothetical protein MRY63_02070 [Neomegalonema sp.]|nr:hypothetical protein [Neomegalonema sp.]
MFRALGRPARRVAVRTATYIAPGPGKQARRWLFNRAARRGDTQAMLDLLSTPYNDEPVDRFGLFRAVDFWLSEERSGLGRRAGDVSLSDLAPLAPLFAHYDQQIFAALSQFHGGDPEGALSRLEALSRDPEQSAQARRGLGAWHLFLQLHRGRHADPLTSAKPGEPLGPLIQFWDKDTPGDVQAEMDRWRALAGDSSYRCFDDRSAKDFIANAIGKREADIYASARHPAIKSDLLRLCALHELGGLYIDADARPQPGLRAILAQLRAVPTLWFDTAIPEAKIINGMISAPARAPFLRAAVEEGFRRLVDAPALPLMALAGPLMLTEIAITHLNGSALHGWRAVPNALGQRQIFRQIEANYKRDARNWHLHERRLDASQQGGSGAAEPPSFPLSSPQNHTGHPGLAKGFENG